MNIVDAFRCAQEGHVFCREFHDGPDACQACGAVWWSDRWYEQRQLFYRTCCDVPGWVCTYDCAENRQRRTA